MGVSLRFDLSPSRRARRLRGLALMLTAMAAGACLLAAATAPTILRGSVALAALAALAVSAYRAGRPAAGRLKIDGDGALQVECGGEIQPASVGYCGRHLVCLRTPIGLVPIWPDALPAIAWRRLLVACRWPHAAEQARAPEAAN